MRIFQQVSRYYVIQVRLDHTEIYVYYMRVKDEDIGQISSNLCRLYLRQTSQINA
jgi:hypothetical protein